MELAAAVDPATPVAMPHLFGLYKGTLGEGLRIVDDVEHVVLPFEDDESSPAAERALAELDGSVRPVLPIRARSRSACSDPVADFLREIKPPRLYEQWEQEDRDENLVQELERTFSNRASLPAGRQRWYQQKWEDLVSRLDSAVPSQAKLLDRLEAIELTSIELPAMLPGTPDRSFRKLRRHKVPMKSQRVKSRKRSSRKSRKFSRR